MDDELKPCPFCGKEGQLEITSCLGGRGGCELYTWIVRCYHCKIKTVGETDEAVRDDAGIRLTVDGRALAIAAWNRRAEPTP